VLCFDDEQHVFLENLRGVLRQKRFVTELGSFDFYDPRMKAAVVEDSQDFPESCDELYKNLQQIAC
jgi:hypothetical protein